jgi:putative FmdB family regulatory protein
VGGFQLGTHCAIKVDMPIYEYSCKKCGNVIEKIRKFSDPPLKKHPDCGGSLTKLISQSSFQLKGSGWYVTDYAGKGKAESGEKVEKSGSDDGASKDSKADTDAKKTDGTEKKESKKKSANGAKK